VSLAGLRSRKRCRRPEETTEGKLRRSAGPKDEEDHQGGEQAAQGRNWTRQEAAEAASGRSMKARRKDRAKIVRAYIPLGPQRSMRRLIQSASAGRFTRGRQGPVPAEALQQAGIEPRRVDMYTTRKKEGRRV